MYLGFHMDKKGIIIVLTHRVIRITNLVNIDKVFGKIPDMY